MRLGEAETPEGMRIYAIGDVHGMDELLAEAHAKIAADLAARPVADYRIVHVGDYVDRGPDSAAVIERLARLKESDPRVICLLGNHDETDARLPRRSRKRRHRLADERRPRDAPLLRHRGGGSIQHGRISGASARN